jgi:hypothetical protein
VQSAAISAHSVGIHRVQAEADYTDPWVRQWRRPAPPTTTEEIVHELPLWYLAQILRNLRALFRKRGEVWSTGPDEWSRIGAAMRLAKNAIVGGSLEARTTAGTRLKAARTERQRRSGPKLSAAPMADVLPLHVG